jgi:hypothetical protein
VEDLTRHLAESHTFNGHWWLYKFPNGRGASVISDPRPEQPFRFEMEVDNAEGGTTILPCLTTEQVEANLRELAAATD